MNRVLARLRSRLLGHGRSGIRSATWPAPCRLDRSDAALGRLQTAREGFDASVVALRKAALDHVDVQDLASTAIRANLDRLALSLGRDLIGRDVSGALRDAVGDA